MKSRLSSPALLVPVVLILAALAWFGYQYYAGVAARAADRARLLEHIAIELAKERPDSSELSRLVARIEEFPDHATAADLLGARARIELERGRPERAVELFLPVATSPAASAADRGLAAQMLLARHAGGLPSRADAVN
ncbi:MAG: hypothetical protein KDE27_02820, partial [Planctomycetes bacterium]|nr:hypothetical protein [Planctomycetota bacterium]